MTLKAGDQVSHYRILERLGRGGMGVVYRAEDTTLRRQVALKFLPSDDQLLPQARERFFHEARAASALDHPNICTIHEIGETGEGQTFIVMACYDGETLSAKLKRGPLAIAEGARIAVQVCEGVGAAHERGIVHRDLKPDNIMVLSTGLVKVLDFGLAKLSGQSKLTASGTTLGTAPYMSPEQVNATEVDHRTDIYSLSVILYEMVTGSVPFWGDHQLAIMYLVVNQPPKPPRSINPSIPEELERVILRGMSKEPENRYQSLGEMKEQLLPFLGPPAAGPRKAVPPPASKWKFTRRNAIALSAIAFLILAAVCALFVIPHLVPSLENGSRLDAQAHTAQAVTHFSNQDFISAKKEAQQAITADSLYSSAWSTLSAADLRLGQLDRAIVEARRAVELDSTSRDGFFNLAFALEDKGELAEALQCYERTVRLDSLFMRARSTMGNLLIRMGEPVRAVQVLQSALATQPDWENIFLVYRNLGKAYLKLGQIDESIRALKKSLELQPVTRPTPLVNSEPLYYLAVAYREKGAPQETRGYAEQYLRQSWTDSLLKREAQQLLDRLEKK